MISKKLSVQPLNAAIEKVPTLMDHLEKHSINQINWPEYSYNVKVDFSIAYSEQFIFLKYWVEENSIIAKTDKDNGPVWKDSCVEFFISPDATDNYYNFEFNCIGVCLMGYGNSRHNRIIAPEAALSGITRIPSFEKKTFDEKKGSFKWNLFVAIPASAFFQLPGVKFIPGKKMKANFYKCGDGLSTPHYLTWSPVSSEKPDYHRPEFFGEINLI